MFKDCTPWGGIKSPDTLLISVEFFSVQVAQRVQSREGGGKEIEKRAAFEMMKPGFNITCIVLVPGLVSFLYGASLCGAKERGFVGAQAVHYMVMELDRASGAVNLIHHQLVSAHVESKTEAEVSRQMAVNGEKQNFEISVIDAYGQVIFRNVAETPFVIRGEYHGEDGQIDSHFFEIDRPVFVVRVPVRDGKTLQLKSRKKISGASKSAQPMAAGTTTETVATFDLERLAQARSSDMEFLAQAAPDIMMLGSEGSSANRVDLLIMGDGYRAAERSKFFTDAQDLYNNFFDVTPYKEYKNFVKVPVLFLVSNQSGASHPRYDPNCSGTDSSCCADSATQDDPKRGTYVDNALGSTFCDGGQIERLLASNSSKAMVAAAAYPDWDIIMVLVNDDTYGGEGGGNFSTVSTNPSMVKIAQHEHGHAFTRLDDEYSYGCSQEECSRCKEADKDCAPNVTDATDRSQIKWSPWILPSTPIPTPNLEDWPASVTYPYVDTVGLFEGAMYVETGLYRPQNDCKMRSLGAPFCAICTQEYIRVLYGGGWGIPKDGIDLIEPGSESPTPGTLLSIPGQVFNFKINLLQPAGGRPLEVSWLVDGVQISSGTNYFSYTLSAPRAKVELTVRDTTTLVNPAMADDLLVSRRVWDVTTETISTPAVSGPAHGRIGRTYTFTMSATDSLGYPVQYFIDWGDGTNSDWLPAGARKAPKTWTVPGIYSVRARARSTSDISIMSVWSNSLPVSINVPKILAPSAHYFGSVKVERKKAASLKIANIGKADLRISISITGTDASMFTSKAGSGIKIIKPSGTLTIPVVFEPTASGSKSSTLKINSNDPVTPTVDILLSGTGR